jgi:hypothetical protein
MMSLCGLQSEENLKQSAPMGIVLADTSRLHGQSRPTSKYPSLAEVKLLSVGFISEPIQMD